MQFILFFKYFFACKKIFSTMLSTENVRNTSFIQKINKLRVFCIKTMKNIA